MRRLVRQSRNIGSKAATVIAACVSAAMLSACAARTDTTHTGARNGLFESSEQPPNLPQQQDEQSKQDAIERLDFRRDSPILQYIGEKSEFLFFSNTDGVSIATIGDQKFPDREESDNFCRKWEMHLTYFYDSGRLTLCKEYGYSPVRLDQSAQPEELDFRTMQYEFDRLRPDCLGLHYSCDDPPMSHELIAFTPVCGKIKYHVFQDTAGKNYAILVSTDFEFYKRETSINSLYDRKLRSEGSAESKRTPTRADKYKCKKRSSLKAR